ncbi:hypothetical protein ACPDHL_01935 [Myroides sp. C15-4]|uniref:hypothetical protein n=1 Tax=Myroides sp. C15-4 TaxID=3400532 RepID=UPI003D2F9491
MRKLFGLFWLLFFLYFIFGHPAIIYYGSEYPNRYLEHENPTTSLVLLGISLVLWMGIWLVLLRIVYRYTLQRKWNINKINRTGKRLEARIVQASGSTVFQGNDALKNIVLSLRNLEQESIQHQMEVRDSQPEKRRFMEGKIIHLRVDPTFTQQPYVIVEGSKGKVNVIFFMLWLLLVGGVSYYYVFSYQLESRGYGWRFLSITHPLVSSALFLILFSGIFYLVFKFLIFKKLNIGVSSLALKFKGKRAVAQLLQLKQTGTYINEQPEVEFTVVYVDQSGMEQQAKIKKIVSLIELGALHMQKEGIVFYDPQDKTNVMFEADLTNE